MILQCVLVGQKIFPIRDDAKLGRERSFRNSPAARSEKIFRGLVWHHHSLKISFGLREHTVMPHYVSVTDFCAHVGNHFFVSEVITIDGKIRASLSMYGPPIIQGAISTLLAVWPLSLVDSYILQTFTKMVFLVIVSGVLHGLVFLPTFLVVIYNFIEKIKRSDCCIFTRFVVEFSLAHMKKSNTENNNNEGPGVIEMEPVEHDQLDVIPDAPPQE